MGFREINQNTKKVKNTMELYIGFSTRTHKIYAKMFCKKFRHCAPVLFYKNKCVIYQFVKQNKIVPITIKHRDIKILQQYGWVFIKYNNKFILTNTHALTCVQFTKASCGIKNKAIQRPDALFKYITNK